jgi:hypothetical protein
MAFVTGHDALVERDDLHACQERDHANGSVTRRHPASRCLL